VNGQKIFTRENEYLLVLNIVRTNITTAGTVKQITALVYCIFSFASISSF
jgi:hypothetical protein